MNSNWQTCWPFFSNLTYEVTLTSASEEEIIYLEVVACEIEYVSAKVPFCQVDQLTVYDGKPDCKLFILRINKFLEISPSTAFQARAVTGRLLCLRRLENVLRVPL